MKVRTCAIMSSFNEADIIEESISKLINQGVDVYLIDNGSTDNSIEIAKKYLNKGLIEIKTAKFYENGKEVYDWTKLLALKQDIAKSLDYDWFIHVDADEIRYSPWKKYNLSEGISIVNSMGYNLINFKLFNFHLTTERERKSSVEEGMQYYSKGEDFNRMQVKAWKKDLQIDLLRFAGHIAVVKEPNIFPTRFIHKHYPIRSIEQGARKILKERLGRYSQSDKAKGWHIHYDHMNVPHEQLKSKIIKDQSNLELFGIEDVRDELLIESARIISTLQNFNNSTQLLLDDGKIYQLLKSYKIDTSDIIDDFKIIINKVQSLILEGHNFDDIVSNESGLKEAINKILQIIALNNYLLGDPLLWDKSIKRN